MSDQNSSLMRCHQSSSWAEVDSFCCEPDFPWNLITFITVLDTRGQRKWRFMCWVFIRKWSQDKHIVKRWGRNPCNWKPGFTSAISKHCPSTHTSSARVDGRNAASWKRRVKKLAYSSACRKLRSWHLAIRWGNSGNSGRLYFFGLQNHCRWWLQPWN